MKNKKINYRLNNYLTLIFVFFIIVLINVFSNMNFLHKDLTEDSINSLKESTEKILSRIDSELEIKVFYKKENKNLIKVKKLMEEFEIKSDMLKVYFYDPDRYPEKAIEYNVKNDVIIISYNGTFKECYGASESKIISVINSLINPQELNVYFLKGHGERDYADYDAESMSDVYKTLKESGYKVKDLYLSREKIVPEDCDILIIASPKSDPTEEEYNAIVDYYDHSGKLFIMLDTDMESGSAFVDVAKYVGIDVYNGFVVDFLSNLENKSTIPASYNYKENYITDNLPQTFFAFSRGIKESKRKPKGEYNVKELIFSSDKDKSYIETGYNNSNKRLEFDPNKDVKGPVCMYAISKKTFAVRKDNPEPVVIDGRAVVCGDSSFASNIFLGKGGNRELFFNSIEWLSADKNIITVVKDNDEIYRAVTLNGMARIKIFWISVVLIPLLIAMVGILVVYRRERE